MHRRIVRAVVVYVNVYIVAFCRKSQIRAVRSPIESCAVRAHRADRSRVALGFLFSLTEMYYSDQGKGTLILDILLAYIRGLDV